MIYVDLFLFILISILTLYCIFLSWSRLVKIYYHNASFFDVFFMFIYPFEEIIFLFLYYLEPLLRDLWVALIIIILCSTEVLDKWLLKKQHANAKMVWSNKGKEKSIEFIKKLKDLIEQIHGLEKEQKELLKYIDKRTKKTKAK